MKNQKKIYTAIKILASVGLLLAVYLLWQQISRPEFQPCYVNSLINCDAVISGPVAKTLGIPTPIYGLVGYVVILAATFYGKKKLLLGTGGFGVAFCLWLGYVELFQLRVICPVCITCQLIMLTIFGLAIFVNRKKSSEGGEKI